MTQKKKPWKQVGTIRQSEEGKLYIKLHGSNNKEGKFDKSGLSDLIAALDSADDKGIALQIEKPQDKINRLCSLGFIEEGDLERRLNAVPAYIKYEISLPPQTND